MRIDREIVLRRVTPALVAAALTFAIPTWLVTGGAVWRFAARHELLRYIPFEQRDQAVEQLVRNYAIIHEAPDAARPLVAWVGSSHAGLAVDPPTAEAVWAAGGWPGRARVLWLPAVDMLSAYLLTQQLGPDAARAVVLGLSPHMTMFNPDAPDAQTEFAWMYAGPGHPYPLDFAGPSIAATWWCPPFRLRSGLWMVARAQANKFRHPEQTYRLTAIEPDSMMPFNNRYLFEVHRWKYTQTRDLTDYTLSFGGFRHGATFIGWRREVFATWVWAPTTPPWAFFREWRRLVRARGAIPIVVLLPINPLFQDPGFSAILPGGDPTRPILDPARLAQWTADVRRAVSDTPGLLLWDDLHQQPPEAFYDVEHMLPEARVAYTRLVAQRLLDAGVLGPRREARAR